MYSKLLYVYAACVLICVIHVEQIYPSSSSNPYYPTAHVARSHKQLAQHVPRGPPVRRQELR